MYCGLSKQNRREVCIWYIHLNKIKIWRIPYHLFKCVHILSLLTLYIPFNWKQS